MYTRQKEQQTSISEIAHNLTHISLASFLRDIGNSTDSDQTPHSAASDQGLRCLRTECSIKI